MLALIGAHSSGAKAQAEPFNAPPLSLAEYDRLLQRVEQQLGAEDDPATATAAARVELAAVQKVALPSGEVITLTPLLGDEEEFLTAPAAKARLTAVLAQLKAASGDETAARLAVLAAVLTGPAFQHNESWWDATLRRLAEWFDRWLPSGPSGQSSPINLPARQDVGNWVAWGIGGAGALALVLLLAYWLRGFIGSFAAGAGVLSDGEQLEDSPQTPAGARRRAAGSAQAGDYRNAVRNLYLSALLTLEQKGLVPADRSLTNRELLAQVAANPLHSHLRPVVETFDDVWYGVQQPDTVTYNAYMGAIDQLETLAQQVTKEVQP